MKEVGFLWGNSRTWYRSVCVLGGGCREGFGMVLGRDRRLKWDGFYNGGGD